MIIDKQHGDRASHERFPRQDRSSTTSKQLLFTPGTLLTPFSRAETGLWGPRPPPAVDFSLEEVNESGKERRVFPPAAERAVGHLPRTEPRVAEFCVSQFGKVEGMWSCFTRARYAPVFALRRGRADLPQSRPGARLGVPGQALPKPSQQTQVNDIGGLQAFKNGLHRAHLGAASL